MTIKLIAGVILISCLLSLILTLKFLSKNIKKTFSSTLVNFKDRKKLDEKSQCLTRKTIKEVIRSCWSSLRLYLSKLLTIDSSRKLIYFLFALSFAVIGIVPKDMVWANGFGRYGLIIASIIVLVGIAKFLNFRFGTGGIDNLYYYLIKMLIFLTYSTMFLLGYLMLPNNLVLFIASILITLLYSISFLSSIIDGFQSVLFYVLNLLFIYVYDIFIFSFQFGYFYLIKNNVYGFYNSTDILNDATIANFLAIAQGGLSYLFSLTDINNPISVLNYIPLFEYILGLVFNILIIGVFISYTASKIYEKNSKRGSNT